MKNAHGGMLLLQPETLLKVTVLHGCFHVLKLYKWFNITQSVTYEIPDDHNDNNGNKIDGDDSDKNHSMNNDTSDDNDNGQKMNPQITLYICMDGSFLAQLTH